MLKDTEPNPPSRRKLSLTEHQQQPASSTASTPPFTPPTPTHPPLSVMATAAQHADPTALAAECSAIERTHDTANTMTATQANAKLTPSSMAATLLANAAAVAAMAANPHISSATIASTGAGSLQDHYSLRWNNHQSHILRAFDALLQSKALVDVTLVCAESSIHAHKMVLSACSPFFQRVFAETPCKHPVIVLKDFRGWVVQAIVDFMYRGEISVPQERLQTLIQAGESLQVRGLVESSIPEHTPTPAASPDDFGMIDTSLMSSELERCSSFDDESPSMVTAGSKVILPSRLFGASARRERKRGRERDRERERDLERDLESDQELHNESGTHSDICTSPMPRRKQARPRRRSGELPHDLSTSKPASPIPAEDSAEPIKTVIKHELNDLPADEQEHERDDAERAEDSGNGNDSHVQNESHEKSDSYNEMEHEEAQSIDRHALHTDEFNDAAHGNEEDEDEMDAEAEAGMHDGLEEHDDEHEDIDELIAATTDLRSKSQSCLSDGPEDLCTTKKDGDGNVRRHSISDAEAANNNNNNNNNSKLNNNNNRIVLSLKDIRQLNKPSSSSTPNAQGNNINPFASSLRDMRMERAANAAEHHCKMEALEAQMHAAAAAAAAAAANGENPFQHMEHQMDLSLAAAAAAAASRERDQALQRDQRELQHQHNAYANSLLGSMGMPPLSGNGAGGNGAGQSAHERLEESMNRLSKEFTPSSPMNLPTHFNPPDGPPHPPSPLPFPGMSSALTLTPPHHMFGLDSPLGLFPPGIDPGKLYNPLMDMGDPRGLGGDPPPFLKKKMPRPKGQHSAPRGGPPRSWTNAELTEALQHVWNKKMTTSQASRIFGIPYNSLLMYVRGKYGKSLKLEQLRKDCISGPPLELLQMGISSNSGGKNSSNRASESGEGREGRDKKERNASSQQNELEMGSTGGGSGPGGSRSASSEPDLLGGPNSLFNPFPQGFYPDFASGFPGLPLSMLNLLPPTERHQQHGGSGMHHLGMDEDCKSDRSKHSSTMDDDFGSALGQPLALNSRDEPPAKRVGSSDFLAAQQNPSSGSVNAANPNASAAVAQQNGANAQD